MQQLSLAIAPEVAVQQMPALCAAVQQLLLQATTALSRLHTAGMSPASQGEALPVESTLIAASHSSSTTGSAAYCQPYSRCQATGFSGVKVFVLLLVILHLAVMVFLQGCSDALCCTGCYPQQAETELLSLRM